MKLSTAPGPEVCRAPLGYPILVQAHPSSARYRKAWGGVVMFGVSRRQFLKGALVAAGFAPRAAPRPRRGLLGPRRGHPGLGAP